MSIDPTKKRATRITCARHIAPFLKAELEGLGWDLQHADATGVQIGASLIDCMGLNLTLRTAEHIYWQLLRFACPSPKALYKHIASFPWESLIPNDGYFCVSNHVSHPKISNSLYASRLVKDAIVDRLVDRTGARPDSGPDRSRLVLHLYWHDNQARLYLDTTGQRLADRGYRKIPGPAPMRETLAAAVLMACGYDGSQPLVNPMCGSGTLAIEAALMATGRAPGLLRSNFSLLHTQLDLRDAWREARKQAHKQRRAVEAGPIPPIIASDIEPRAIKAAQANARAAGVEQHIEFIVCDVAQTPMPTNNPHAQGIVVMNPAYGQRLGEMEKLGVLYERIGAFFKQHCAGWTGCVLTGSRELAGKIGLRASRKVPFFNANIECRLLCYALYAGSRNRI